MSGHGAAKTGGLARRAVQLLALASLFALLFLATRAVPESQEGIGAIAAVGFLLLAGALTSELLEPLGLPHLSGYLIAGIAGGPHALHLVDHETVTSLSSVNALALALIALAGGAELRTETVRKGLRSLLIATLVQTVFVFIAMTLTFAALRPFIPFARSLSTTAALGVAALWGVLSVTRSPSACLGILSQTRATGPVATSSLTFIMSSDVLVVLLLAMTITLVKPLIDPGASFSAAALSGLGHEMLGSVALGTTLGLVLAAYIRLIGAQLVLVFVLLGFVVTEALRYVHFDPLLTFMVTGFTVQNFTKQGEKLLHAVEETGSVVFIVFFAIAGAHLDIPLLKQLWAIALTLCVTRTLVTWVASRVASRLANDPPMIKKWAWSGLVSQAGLALGVSAVIERTFPSIGPGFRAMAIAAVALNEMIGPVLFKLGLDRAGEIRKAPHA